MKKILALGAFFAFLLIIQLVVWSCACEAFRYQYFYLGDRVDFFSETTADEKDTLNVDWVRRTKWVAGDKIKVAFVAKYNVKKEDAFRLGSPFNEAYAECLPDYYVAGDTVTNIDVITINALQGIKAGESILSEVGWTGKRLDSLIYKMNYGLFPQSPTIRFNLKNKPLNPSEPLQLMGVISFKRGKDRKAWSPEVTWRR